MLSRGAPTPAEWCLVLGACGDVVGVDGGAPSAWRGCEIDACIGLPEDARRLARALVGDVRRAGRSVATGHVGITVDGVSRVLRLVAVQAVGLYPTRIDLRALLASAVAALQRQAHAIDVDLRVEVAADVPASVALDPEKLAWIVASLAGNALRHVKHGTRSFPGGTIRVRATRDDGGLLVIAVSDDGSGVPSDLAARLFARAPGAQHARAVALAVVRDVAAAHGGTFELQTSTDALDHGTTVTIRLPIG